MAGFLVVEILVVEVLMLVWVVGKRSVGDTGAGVLLKDCW